LISVATASPPHVVPQAEARRFAARAFAREMDRDSRLMQVFENTGIEQRYVSMPLEWYGSEHDFQEKNDRFVEVAVGLAEEASRRALDRALLTPADVDHVVFVTSTGIATPSIDARLANSMGFREDVRRTPVWGLGCAGGAAGVALARQLAAGEPASVVLVIALELCTLAFQPRDASPRNVVATSLFADGAAALVVVGRAHAAAPRERELELVATHTTMWKDTLDVMGWTVDGEGLHVVFSRDIPTIVRDGVRPALEKFLSTHGLGFEQLAHMAVHPGGPKVQAAYAEALGLPLERFEASRETLREHGNMSSPTCLFVLERILSNGVRPGDPVLIAALGPGFSANYVLARVSHGSA
jgi:alkylresorcinol/alkylpyrone synthase